MKTVVMVGVVSEKKHTGITLASTFARTSRIHPYKMRSTSGLRFVCPEQRVTLRTATLTNSVKVNLKGKTPAALLKDMLFLRESGFNIPDDALKFVQWQVWEQKGIKEVWECPKCGEQLELMVKIKDATCRKSHTMKVLWRV